MDDSIATKWHIKAALIYLLLTFALFELSNLDIAVQSYFFDMTSNTWLWPKKEPWLKLFLYDTPKVLLALLALTIIFALAFFNKKAVIKAYKQPLIIMLASLITTPLIIGGLKATTNTACPAALANYGGAIPYIKVLESYPTGRKPTKLQKCFPAGHASGGFALLAFVFLFKTKANRQRAALLALSTGWIMGGYKIAIGDHFLSHTLITMGVAWLVSCTIALVLNQFYLPKTTNT